MRAFSGWPASALLSSLAACGGGGDGGPGADNAAVATPPPTVVSAPDGMPAMLTLPLEASGNSGTTGTARLVARGEDSTVVTVTLRGPGDGTHPGYIQLNTCADLSMAAHPLGSVSMVGGTGTSTATLGAPLVALMNRQFSVNFHAGSGADPFASVACGEIPLHPAR